MFAQDLPPIAQPLSFVHKRIIGAVGGFISGGPIGALAGFAGGGGSRPTRPGPGADRGAGLGAWPGSPLVGRAPTTCNWPMKRDPNTGLCRTFAGSQPGLDRGREAPGEAVAGGFNMPAFVPDVVGTITRIDGSSGPILRCPRGTVLATDDLCYAKGTKGLSSHRKWKPGRRPFLPPTDLRALDRVAALKGNKVLRGRIKALGLC